MNHTPDTTTAGNGGNFDPQQAAALLDQTTQQARRRLEPAQPWLLVIRAVAVLAAFGAVWLISARTAPLPAPDRRGHPRRDCLRDPQLRARQSRCARRATAGVSGRSRLRPAEIAALAMVWAGVFAVMAALAGAGVSDAVVYGLYPAAVPLIAAGLAWAAIMAARANWRACGTGLAVAAVGAVAAFAGPAGAWLVAGVGLCTVLLGSAAVIVWRQRRSVVRP